MNTSFHFVIHPQAGRGKALRTWQSIQELIRTQRVLGEDRVTHSLTNDNFPYQQLNKDTVLVAVGGDGSVHHTGNIAFQHGFAMGVIPSGTGNDYAHTIGIPLSLPDSLHVLLNGTPEFVDVVRINGDIAFNAGGFGLDAAVVDYVEAKPWLKRVGPVGYALALPTILRRYKPYSLSITVDGVRERYHQVSLCAIANGPTFGGGMRVAPTANPFDGKLDVCVVSGIRKLTLLRLFPSIYKGRHIENQNVTVRRGEHIQIDFHPVIPAAEWDGEPVPSSSSVDIRVVHQQMRVVQLKAEKS